MRGRRACDATAAFRVVIRARAGSQRRWRQPCPGGADSGRHRESGAPCDTILSLLLSANPLLLCCAVLGPGDVLLHTVTDAILGALCLPDIGECTGGRGQRAC